MAAMIEITLQILTLQNIENISFYLKYWQRIQFVNIGRIRTIFRNNL